ncbi:DNA-binding transcriptional LysR family regulator [Devosia sp. UYZn731]|uniref:LysR family transcriptional regulator n=1 Tax=Devosia sp. UYZn731 TaxID=3156345 RepID=UPI0033977FA2
MLTSDDLKFIAVLARFSSASSVARALNTHVATVYRRLRSLELLAGQQLFVRVQGRYEPTPLGTALAASSESIDLHLADANRRLAGEDARLDGHITITTADSLVPLVSRLLASFREQQPRIGFSLAVSNSFADMTRYEAEVAIRPTKTPPEALVGRQAGNFSYWPFRSGDHPVSRGWIALEGNVASIPAARWITDNVDADDIVLRVDSMWAAAQAASAGLGQALLPSYLGRELDLVPCGETIDVLQSEVWMLIHPDLRRTSKIRAFLGFGAPYLRASLDF